MTPRPPLEVDNPQTTDQLTKLGMLSPVRLSVDFRAKTLPGMGVYRGGPAPEDLGFVRQVLAARPEGSRVPDNFAVTARPFDPARDRGPGSMPQQPLRSPQTIALLQMLGLEYTLDGAAGAGAPLGIGKQAVLVGSVPRADLIEDLVLGHRSCRESRGDRPS